MKKNNSGYDAGKKAWGEMCGDGAKVQVKAYARGGAVKKVAVKTVQKSFPKAPPMPTPTSMDTPKLAKVVKKADGGAVKVPPLGKQERRETLKAFDELDSENLGKQRRTLSPFIGKGKKLAQDRDDLADAKDAYRKQPYYDADVQNMVKEGGYKRGGKVKKMKGK